MGARRCTVELWTPPSRLFHLSCDALSPTVVDDLLDLLGDGGQGASDVALDASNDNEDAAADWALYLDEPDDISIGPFDTDEHAETHRLARPIAVEAAGANDNDSTKHAPA